MLTCAGKPVGAEVRTAAEMRAVLKADPPDGEPNRLMRFFSTTVRHGMRLIA